MPHLLAIMYAIIFVGFVVAYCGWALRIARHATWHLLGFDLQRLRAVVVQKCKRSGELVLRSLQDGTSVHVAELNLCLRGVHERR